jgi:hypothetical protein
MRVFSNSVMTALVVLALFLGNCLSCPQILLSLSSHQPAHGCCPRSHQPVSKTTCQSQALQHYVQAEKEAPPAPAVIAMVRPPFDLLPLQPATDFGGTPEISPPDLVSLNSSFRI